MKEYLENINKAFESKARLGIMSILIVNESVDFVTLKNLLDLTDGNLASPRLVRLRRFRRFLGGYSFGTGGLAALAFGLCFFMVSSWYHACLLISAPRAAKALSMWS